ncbi:MAG: hypothetical protein KHX31_03990 [Akkermansia sp.]|uniref:sugar-transfer associated ATP-grasp domain-containing protein n=1 Tax=Akkermansia sp. TaxID=1872421 RepID=UPI0025C5CDF4|nr:sugar-transfer associated ATP-grasp domain-containing protein [Akkermansia sp.]MBS5507777.1 hypothetical protein [Akkermansia sp.]
MERSNFFYLKGLNFLCPHHVEIMNCIRRLFSSKKRLKRDPDKIRPYVESLNFEEYSFYPEESRKSRAQMMDEIIRIYREGGEWDIEDAYVHYMQMGLDRASSRVQEYVFQREFDMARDSRHITLAHMLDYKDVTARYLSHARLPVSVPLGIVDGEGVFHQDFLNIPFAEWLPSCNIPLFLKPQDGVQGRKCFALEMQHREEKLCLLLNGLPIECKEMEHQAANHLVEAKIVQHPEMDILYPEAVNTIRFVTLSDSEGIYIYTQFLLVGSNGSNLSNGRAGGIAVGIDRTGMLNTKGHRNLKSCFGKFHQHPDTGIPFSGFQIPFFEESRQLALSAHQLFPGIHSIGWDIAVTPEGPVIIEANRDWGTLLHEAIYGGDRERFTEIFCRTAQIGL